MVDVWRVKNRFSFCFEKVVAEKVTESSVFVQGSRVAKTSDGVRYFASFNEAKAYATNALRLAADKARKQMEAAEENLRILEATSESDVKASSSRW